MPTRAVATKQESRPCLLAGVVLVIRYASLDYATPKCALCAWPGTKNLPGKIRRPKQEQS